MALSSNKDTLQGENDFEAILTNNTDAEVKVADYRLAVKVKSSVGSGSKFSYTNAQGSQVPETESVEEPLSHFINKTELASKDTAKINFTMVPGSGVASLVLEFILYKGEGDTKKEVARKEVKWESIEGNALDFEGLTYEATSKTIKFTIKNGGSVNLSKSIEVGYSVSRLSTSTGTPTITVNSATNASGKYEVKPNGAPLAGANTSAQQTLTVDFDREPMVDVVLDLYYDGKLVKQITKK